MSIKKIVAITAGVTIALILVAGVVGNQNNQKSIAPTATSTSSQEQSQAQPKTNESTKATNIESTVAAWKAAGLTVSDDKGAFYQMVGASNGGKYDVGQTNVELYEFSDNTKANKAKTSTFTNDSDTVLVIGTLLVDIHSTDAAQVTPIKSVF